MHQVLKLHSLKYFGTYDLSVVLLFAVLLFITNSMAQEPKGSSLCSQEPSTGPYTEPTENTLQPPQSQFP
jgi:hypothetical protein